MKQIEYMLERDTAIFTKEGFDTVGQRGWQYCGTDRGYQIFKRELDCPVTWPEPIRVDESE